MTLCPLGVLEVWKKRRPLSRKKSQPVPPVPEVSFWKSTVLSHPCLLVSVADLALDEDSLPLRVLARQPVKQEVAVGQFVVAAAE